ncbi:MAG: CheR family methyltransferase [Vulcanimicrobiota bacterium]
MLFITQDKNSFELVMNYLEQNNFISKEVTTPQLLKEMSELSRSRGYKKLDDYCFSLLTPTFGERLKRNRELIRKFPATGFFTNKDQLALLNEKFISKILFNSYEHQIETPDQENWLREELKARIKNQAENEPVHLNVLFPLADSGEKVYSAAMALRQNLPAMVKIQIDALEPKNSYYEKARSGLYKEEKTASIDESYRSVFLQESEYREFEITDDLKELVNFEKTDLLTKELETSRKSYHLVFANLLASFYPHPVARKIIEKILPRMARGAVLFFNSSRNLNLKGLDLKETSGVKYYVRNGYEVEKTTDRIDITIESVSNLLVIANALELEGREDEARDLISRGIENHPESPYLLQYISDLKVKKKDIEKALESYKKVTEIEDEFWPAHFNMAVLNLYLGYKEKAEESFEKFEKTYEKEENKKYLECYDIETTVFETMAEDLKHALESSDSELLKKVFLRLYEVFSHNEKEEERQKTREEQEEEWAKEAEAKRKAGEAERLKLEEQWEKELRGDAVEPAGGETPEIEESAEIEKETGSATSETEDSYDKREEVEARADQIALIEKSEKEKKKHIRINPLFFIVSLVISILALGFIWGNYYYRKMLKTSLDQTRGKVLAVNEIKGENENDAIEYTYEVEYEFNTEGKNYTGKSYYYLVDGRIYPPFAGYAPGDEVEITYASANPGVSRITNLQALEQPEGVPQGYVLSLILLAVILISLAGLVLSRMSQGQET